MDHEIKKVRLGDIKTDPIAEQIMKEPDLRPYLEYHAARLRGEDKQIALDKVAGIPLDKRYVTRILYMLALAFSDFDSETVRVDLQTMSEEELREH